MPDDAELLRRYARESSEDAFAELVRRHVNLVYSAAMRRLGGDAHRVEDVVQSVFTDLARKAPSLSRRRDLVLGGWLYTCAYYTAANLRRGEQRRQRREQEVLTMNETEPPPEPDWDQLRPELDDAMHELNERDREALLLRFFEEHPLAEVGARLGLSENTARMRVERALDKLRSLLARRGITSTSAALAITLAGLTVSAAPAGMAAAVSGASLSAAATASTVTCGKLLTVIAKMKIAIASVVLVAGFGATVLVLKYQAAAAPFPASQSLANVEVFDPARGTNGFALLIQAAQKVKSLPPADLTQPDRAQLAAMVAANAEALTAMRSTLTNDCRPPQNINATYVEQLMPALNQLRNLARALSAEGRLAELEGRLGDATMSYLDEIRLGQEFSRDGVLIIRLVGVACEKSGLTPLGALTNRLDAGQSRVLVRSLENLDDREPSITGVMNTEKSFSDGMRAGQPDVGAAGRAIQEQMMAPAIQHATQGCQSNLLTLRQTIVSFGAHAYEIDKAYYPRKTSDLVPDILRAVPVDPFTDKPLTNGR